MRILTTIAAILCVFLLVLTGCRSDVGEPPSESRAQMLEAPPQALTVENTVDKERSVDTRLQETIEIAVRDLATRLTAKPETIEVTEARYVTWPDSSVGCPRSGLEYMQVLTPGILVVLQHGGSSYHYHGARDGLPFYCAQPRQPVDGHADEATY
jgi:hypothetical protein